MPLWGPYSKKYMGFSRIMKESSISGARWDLVVYPTYANSAVPVPNVTVPSDYHPWEADAEGRFFSYRYELLWKDMLYADVDFFYIEEETYGIRTCYHNNTNKIQNCLLNYFTAIEYPQNMVCTAKHPSESDVWNALDYEEFTLAKTRPWEHLNHDGLKKGEIHKEEFTDGNGLGASFYCMAVPHLKLKWFGGEKGDHVSYTKSLSHDYDDAVLSIRYCTVMSNEDVIFESNYGTICFKAGKTPQNVTLPLGALTKEFKFFMTSNGTETNGIILDYFSITEKAQRKEEQVITENRNMIPTIDYKDNRIEYQYNYGELPVYFNILSKRVRSRNLYSGCLEDALITRLTNSDETYDNLTRSFSGAFGDKHSEEGFYHTNVVEAIFLPGQSTHTEYAYISTKQNTYTQRELEHFWLTASQNAADRNINRTGDSYDFSARLLKASLLSNIVYPIYRYGENVVHYTPGKRWDSLYTWDSGFIGLGVLEYSEERAEYIMDMYLSEENNEDFAFLAHGSLVPTQFYLLHEILIRASAKKREDMKKYYPMFQRYYRYMGGKTEGSTTARLGSGMLTVYDYFYNASGMDDYPPQVAVHRMGLENCVSPVCSNVHFIRIAKIMKQFAILCGCTGDIAEYEEDIRNVSEAFLANSWDQESGYFSYVLHTPEGTEILRTDTGENYNKGVDGVTPLIAGICTKEQQKQLLKHLKNENELWSSIGISTVDRSASYYYDNGYWNGSVWFPYQYLLWKSMFDIGESEFAYQIAVRALSAWKQEVEFSYNTFEMIQIETERGGWFHQFGGLSSPIVIWYHAYYKKGTITTGYETWIEESRFDETYTEAYIKYRKLTNQENVIMVVMDSSYDYRITINGTAVSGRERVKGTIELLLPEETGEIVITKHE